MFDLSLKPYAYPAAYYALELDFFQMDAHCHNRWEIMYLVSGSCGVEVEGRLLGLKERQFITIAPEVPHRLEICRGERCVLLNYEFSCLAKKGGTNLLALAEKSREFSCLAAMKESWKLLDDQGKVGYGLKDLIQELEGREQNDYLLDLIFQRVLIEWSRCRLEQKSPAGTIHLKKAQAFIRDHFTEEISVADVAGHVGLNHSYLQTLFHQSFGGGIMEYINSQRMERAQFLLRNSSMSITDIAFETGFNSRQHFGYTFEKRFHVSPKGYRKLNGQNLSADTGKGQKYIHEEDASGGYTKLIH